MIYRVIGLMSGSSLDGLDIACVNIDETGGTWQQTIKAVECIPYPEEWKNRLQNALSLPADEYLKLHAAYGQYTGELVNAFIAKNRLQYQVNLIASHGHTVFHDPTHKMTAQLGDGAAIAATTGINTVSDLRAMDIALGGQGAPIVPIGEKLLWPHFTYFLNLGGIANIAFHHPEEKNVIGFDVCPANRVMNLLMQEIGKEYDAEGAMAAGGKIYEPLLATLNELPYYQMPFPKSLANSFGTDTVYPLIKSHPISLADALCTYCEHIAMQLRKAIANLPKKGNAHGSAQMMVTGGGALNSFLMSRIAKHIQKDGIEIPPVPEDIINYKEAIIMALMGVLRWREEVNVLASVTGASRSSVGGALWMGE